MTVALVLEWKVIVCEVGGAEVLLKTHSVSPALFFFMSGRERMEKG